MAKMAMTLALSAALAVCSCDLGGAPSRAGEQTARATSAAIAPVAISPIAAAPAAGRSRRPLQDGEMSAAVLRKAGEVLKEHADKPLGTEVPFELEGRRYVARVETHFREPGSAEAGPKGEHRGVTVYAIE